MFPTFVVLGCVAVLAVPALCCRDKEYTTRDGQCCPMCQEGTIVQRDCTPQSGTRCAPCLSGTFMNQANGLTKCFPCTLCNPVQGLFEKLKCKAKTDTVCGVLSGYFCTSFSDDETGCSLAEKHKDCERGQSIRESGTNRSDTVCEDCKPGYFSLDGINCTAWTVCLGTQTKVTEGSSSHDVVCRNASRHHYVLTVPLLLVLSFLITLGFLAKGLVAAFAGPGRTCRTREFTTREGRCCPMCHEGTVVRRDCNQLSGTLCVPCDNGTFMNQPNGLSKCFPCATCYPGLGLSVQQNCTATTDTVCGVLEGYFCKSLSDDGTGCSLADKHRDCPPGQSVKEAGTSRSDTACEDCQPGHFSEDGVNCTAWTVCSESQTKIREGSSMFDVVCEDETTTSVLSFTFISSFFNSTFWSSD